MGAPDVRAGSEVFVGMGSSATATTVQVGSGCVSSTVFKSPETSLTWEDSDGASSSFHPALLLASESACASALRTDGPSASDRGLCPSCLVTSFASSCRCPGRVTTSLMPPEVSCVGARAFRESQSVRGTSLRLLLTASL